MNKTREIYEQNDGLKDLSKKVKNLERQMKEIKETELKQNDKLKELSKRVEILEKQMKEIKEEKLKELKAELEYAIYLSTL